MKKRRVILIILVFFFSILIISSILSKVYVGFITVSEINRNSENDVELILKNPDIGTVTVKLNKDEQINFSKEPHVNNYIEVSKMLNYITTGEEYFIHLNIYIFPWSLIRGNDIEYISVY
ncbi:hypothetical protein [Bacillus sp. FJAT-47783]|uniref:hypothetical protein n=1 Tax=Bacillus sp. FJAT-47783 TaxID=2922712 RepID=UPI001FAB5EFB|nr:hypothetical protein [Bacillus sp. FJAT-47783]